MRTRLMPENQEAWAFFEEIQFWSGGGFTKKGLFNFGNLSGGLEFFLEFRKVQMNEFELDDLYWKLKIIYSTINRVNADKMDQEKT